MPTLSLDPSVFIASTPAKSPAGFLLSAVVVQELAAGATDKSDLQRLDAVRRTYEKEGRLLVPTSEDWWLAGKVLNSLLRGLKSKASGRTPRISKAEQQRIVRDVFYRANGAARRGDAGHGQQRRILKDKGLLR